MRARTSTFGGGSESCVHHLARRPTTSTWSFHPRSSLAAATLILTLPVGGAKPMRRTTACASGPRACGRWSRKISASSSSASDGWTSGKSTRALTSGRGPDEADQRAASSLSIVRASAASSSASWISEDRRRSRAKFASSASASASARDTASYSAAHALCTDDSDAGAGALLLLLAGVAIDGAGVGAGGGLASAALLLLPAVARARAEVTALAVTTAIIERAAATLAFSRVASPRVASPLALPSRDFRGAAVARAARAAVVRVARARPGGEAAGAIGIVFESQRAALLQRPAARSEYFLFRSRPWRGVYFALWRRACISALKKYS